MRCRFVERDIRHSGFTNKVDGLPDTALRLSRFFGTTPEFWTNSQTAYELSLRKRNISKKSRGMFMQEQMHVLYRLGTALSGRNGDGSVTVRFVN
jgi:hypothetical protein